VVRLKRTISESRNGIWGDDPDGENDLLCVRVADFDRQRLTTRDDRKTYRSIPLKDRPGRILQPGDLLLEKSGGGENTSVGCVVEFTLNEPAVCSNFVARLAPTPECSSRFLVYLHSAIYGVGATFPAIKQTTGIQNLDEQQYLDILVRLPDKPTQESIATSLDRATAKIDALIDEKELLLRLLDKRRQALITEAVTRGLDPTVPMKPSGLPWLGDVPAHWTISPLKHIADLQTGLTLGKNYGNAADLVTRPYLRVANVQDGHIDTTDVTEIAVPLSVAITVELRPGDVLLTEGGDLDKLGRGQVWDGSIKGCLHQNHIFSVRPHVKRLLPEYLSLLTQSLHGKNYFTSTGIRTTNLATTNSTKLLAFPIPLPPIMEQRLVLQAVEDRCAKLAEVAQALDRTTSLLASRRSSLIHEAVTGALTPICTMLP
jgi:type I restriction enzyme S subunit